MRDGRAPQVAAPGDAGAPDWNMLATVLDRLTAASRAGDMTTAGATLAELVPDYVPEGTNQGTTPQGTTP